MKNILNKESILENICKIKGLELEKKERGEIIIRFEENDEGAFKKVTLAFSNINSALIYLNKMIDKNDFKKLNNEDKKIFIEQKKLIDKLKNEIDISKQILGKNKKLAECISKCLGPLNLLTVDDFGISVVYDGGNDEHFKDHRFGKSDIYTNSMVNLTLKELLEKVIDEADCLGELNDENEDFCEIEKGGEYIRKYYDNLIALDDVVEVVAKWMQIKRKNIMSISGDYHIEGDINIIYKDLVSNEINLVSMRKICEDLIKDIISIENKVKNENIKELQYDKKILELYLHNTKNSNTTKKSNIDKLSEYELGVLMKNVVKEDEHEYVCWDNIDKELYEKLGENLRNSSLYEKFKNEYINEYIEDNTYDYILNQVNKFLLKDYDFDHGGEIFYIKNDIDMSYNIELNVSIKCKDEVYVVKSTMPMIIETNECMKVIDTLVVKKIDNNYILNNVVGIDGNIIEKEYIKKFIGINENYLYNTLIKICKYNNL